ncbi:MAG: F0F1 ATP synthase subunit delta [Patescibacteria group bacterium]
MSVISTYLKSLEKIVGQEKFPMALKHLQIAKNFLNSGKKETLEKAADSQTKLKMLEDWFGDFLTNEIKHFLILLSDEQKLSLLDDISEEMKNAKEVVITTAKPLSDQLKKWLIDELNKIDIDKAVAFKWCLDPALIAGIKIKINDREIDNSVQAKLSMF